jgi:hypothetical protein
MTIPSNKKKYMSPLGDEFKCLEEIHYKRHKSEDEFNTESED